MNPARILVVEDECIVAKEIEMRLTAMGYQVVASALNADEALKLAEQHRPDLILMDIRLQGEMDGITVAERIRGRFHLPVIFLTAYSEDTTLQRAKMAEPYGYILKPFEERQLKSAIEIALYKHQAEREILRVNRLFDVLSQVNQAIVRAHSRDDLLDTICRIMVEQGAVNLAWIGWLHPETAMIRPVAHWGRHEELLNLAVFYADDRPEGHGNPGRAIRENKPFLCNECIKGNCLYPAEFAPSQFGFNSCGSFPIHFKGRVCGVLNIGIDEAGFFQEREINLLEEVALDISFALDKLEGDARWLQAEEALRKSEEQYRLLVDTSNEGIWMMDSEHVTTYVNQAMAGMLGYEPSEMIGTKVEDYFFPEDQPFHQQRMKQRHAGEDEVYERRFKRQDDSCLWTLVAAKALKDDQGRFLGSFAMFTDISERKSIEGALRGSEERFRLFMDNSPTIAWIKNEQGQYVYLSKTYEKRFDVRLDEWQGKADAELWAAEVAEAFRRNDLSVLESDCASEVIEQTINADGSQCFWLNAKFAFRDGAGNRFVGGIGLDITERRHAEEMLRQKNSQLQEAVAELERSRNMLHLIIESIPVRVFWKDKDLRFLGCNSLFARDAGFQDPRELLGKDDFAVVWREQGELYRKDDRQVMESGLPRTNIIEPQTTSTGSTIWLSTSKVPLCLPDGEVFGILGIYEDITNRKQAEGALRKSEERHRSILRAAPIGIGVVVDRILTEVNDYLCNMMGYSKEELVGKNARVLYPTQEQYEMVGREKYRQITETGMGTVETQWKRKDGVLLNILLSSSPIDRDDLLVGVTFTALDITERKQAEERLMKSERRFRSISDQAADIIMIHDLHGQFMDVNQQACRSLGYSKEELFSMNVSDIDPEAIASGKAQLWESISDGKRLTFESRLKCKDGSRLPVEVTVGPIEVGKEILVLGIVRDISERIRSAEEKEKMDSQLRQTQKLEAIGTLAGGIAHDFNNILTPIIGYTEMALSGIEESDPIRYDLDEVLTAANRAKDLVKQILSSSRLGEEQLMRPMDASLIVKEALKLIRASLPSTIEIRQNIHKVTVMGDATQIHQIVINLCTNAAHAMEDTGILDVSLLEIYMSEQDLVGLSTMDLRPGKHLKLSVKDSGTGMNPDMMQRIFDPYFTTKEVGKGTGLGLAVVHAIVKRHGGKILVRSEVGKGSVFEVFIPVAESNLKRETAPSEDLTKGSERILLVDDEPEIAKLEARMLEQLGYRVIAKTSPREALDLFSAQPDRFDLVITDYTMPRMLGTELAKECKQIRAEIPVIICTGNSEWLTQQEPDQINGIALGMKPLNQKQLAMLVRDVLDKVRI
jgi:PAS domain S-box-containing protein